MVESGEIDFGRIREMKDYDGMMDAMLAIPGVGNKVADCIMLFSLERPDAFPLDRWMLRVLGTRYRRRVREPGVSCGVVSVVIIIVVSPVTTRASDRQTVQGRAQAR